jgi:hypothetical protein
VPLMLFVTTWVKRGLAGISFDLAGDLGIEIRVDVCVNKSLAGREKPSKSLLHRRVTRSRVVDAARDIPPLASRAVSLSISAPLEVMVQAKAAAKNRRAVGLSTFCKYWARVGFGGTGVLQRVVRSSRVAFATTR